MAASSVLVGNSLGVRYKVGVDAKGKDVFKEQNFKNISANATDDELVLLSDGVVARGSFHAPLRPPGVKERKFVNLGDFL